MSRVILGPLNNQPSLTEETNTGWLNTAEDEVPSSEEKLSDYEKYYFGIDFGPFWFQPLGGVFGLTKSVIGSHVRHALRNHMGRIGGGGWRADARYQRKIFSDGETHHSHGSLPKTDDLSTYHGYHGMMLVAATLLK